MILFFILIGLHSTIRKKCAFQEEKSPYGYFYLQCVITIIFNFYAEFILGLCIACPNHIITNRWSAYKTKYYVRLVLKPEKLRFPNENMKISCQKRTSKLPELHKTAIIFPFHNLLCFKIENYQYPPSSHATLHISMSSQLSIKISPLTCHFNEIKLLQIMFLFII